MYDVSTADPVLLLLLPPHHQPHLLPLLPVKRQQAAQSCPLPAETVNLGPDPAFLQHNFAAVAVPHGEDGNLAARCDLLYARVSARAPAHHTEVGGGAGGGDHHRAAQLPLAALLHRGGQRVAEVAGGSRPGGRSGLARLQQ